MCEREPDLIFPGNLRRQIPHLMIESHYWEFTGRTPAAYDAGKSPAEPQIQIYFDFCSDQPQMFF